MKIFVLLIAICAGVLGWYNFHTATTASARENLAYRSEMASLIGNIKDYGLKHNNDFFVIANGGAGLMESNEFLSEQELGQLLQKVDGVMAESVNYGWDMSMDNPMPPEEQENFQRLLGSARRAGVVPMVLDYAEEAGNVQKAYREDKDRGYLGWVSARRDLDRLPKGLPHNDNDKSVANLREAKNYLVLLNPEAFPSREAYISALANSNYDLLIVDAYYGDKPITKDEVQRLQQMVDDKKIAMTPAVELSYLKPEEQQMLLTAIDSEQATPSLSQAQRMKKLSRDGKLNDDTMLDIMMEQKKPEGYNVVLSADKLRKYFPRSYTPQKMEETILKLLDAWLRKRQRDQSR